MKNSTLMYNYDHLALKSALIGSGFTAVEAYEVANAAINYDRMLEHLKALENVIARLGDEPIDRIVQQNALTITRSIILHAEGGK